MFRLFKKNKGCNHFFKEDSRVLVSKETDWSCFDGNYGSEPDHFENYLVTCVCVKCGHVQVFRDKVLA